MCTHVDDLLYSFLPEGEEVMKSFLAKFSVGSSDTNSFRYCGKQFVRGDDKVIKVDTADNTRKIHGADVGSRLGSERLQQGDITKLRSITGSLAWISRQTRPDLGYRVSRLQSSIKDATVSTLADANAVVVLAHNIHDVALCFPAAHLQWSEVGVITVTDASFSNEKNYKSQQGRTHFLGDLKEIKDDKTTTYKVMPLSFGSPHAFSHISDVRHVQVEAGIHTIGEAAWQSCLRLQVVQLPSTVVCVQDGVFRRSYALRTVLAPGCKYFGICIFEECCSLVQIGAQGAAANQLAPQAQVRPRAFEKCSALRQSSFEETEYDPANLTRCLPECCFLEAGIVSLHLSADFNWIGPAACELCKRLQLVDLSRTDISEILGSTFAHCSQLERLSLANKLRRIGREAF